MFGHSAAMVAHKLRILLPCDDRLWETQSGFDVAGIESNLISVEGRKAVSFLGASRGR